MNIILQPQRFSPANNSIIFQIESDYAAIIAFAVDVIEVETGAIIHSGEYECRPDYKTGTIIQLNKILSNFVNWQVNNSLNILVAGMKKPVLNYKLQITERGLVNGVTADLGTMFETDPFYTWEAEMNSFFFDTYNQQDYLITIGLPAKFLTNKPDRTIVNDYSAEQLYFLHESEDDLKLVIKTYDANNSLVQSTTTNISDLDKYKMFRLNISPKALSETLLLNFSNIKYYTIYIEDEDGKIKTETRTYLYQQMDCSIDPTNILWVNSMGGLDSYQFVNVVSTTNISKSTIQKNTYGFDNGIYSNRTGEMINPFEEVINVNKSGSYTGYSKFVSDDESEWFNELFISKQVFVELIDESLVPVLVTNNSYQVQKQKYSKRFNSISVSYTINGDIIPARKIQIEQGFGSGEMQSDFIDKQMNDWDTYDTVLTFTTDVIDGKEGVGGTVNEIDNIIKFEFNKIYPLYGLPKTMLIKIAGVEVISIDFMQDYLTHEFRFTNTDGTEYRSTFSEGDKNF